MSIVTSGTAGAAISSWTAATTASRPSPWIAPDVELEMGLGDDVRPGPAVDDPDVAGHPGPAAGERVQLRDEVRGGEDRAAALLRLDAGVGGPAVDDDPGIDDPLARADDVAVGPGALEDERTSASAASSVIAVEVRRGRSPRRGWRRT